MPKILKFLFTHFRFLMINMFENNIEKEKLGLGDEIGQAIQKLVTISVLEVSALQIKFYRVIGAFRCHFLADLIII
jgi:hypothetical protein